MLRTTALPLFLALLVVRVGGSRELGGRSLRRAAAASGQPAGEANAVQDAFQDTLGGLGQDVATAGQEVLKAAEEASSPILTDPQGALEGAIGAAESGLQDAVSGEGLITDALVKSQGAVPAALPRPGPPAPEPTWKPAPLNGVFCRGLACRYRIEPTRAPAGVRAGAIEKTAPSEEELSEQEFCRGLGCIQGAGHPADPSRQEFINNCTRLFRNVTRGFKGDDARSQILEVRESFNKVCRQQMDFQEASACPGYADVLVAALSPLVREPGVGGFEEVCSNTLTFIRMSKQAEVDFKLVSAALPPVGKPEDSTAYEVAAGSLDGAAPPVTVPRDLFVRCTKWVGEMANGTSRTASAAVVMARGWCLRQTIVTTWIGVRSRRAYGHPEWNGRTCTGISKFFSFALREDMDRQSTIATTAVCKKLFLAVHSVHGADRVLRGALARLSERASAPPSQDPELRRLAQDAREHSEQVRAKFRAQKEAFEDLEAAKAQVADYRKKNGIDPVSGAALITVSRSLRSR